MGGVDLDRYTFDYDLTFAALLMHPDGTIYRTYAGRDWRRPQSHLSTESLARALLQGSKDHAFHERAAKRNARKPTPGPTIEQLPAMARRIASGKAPKCFHCHMVYDARHEEAVERGLWKRSALWRWPDPIEIGLTLDRDDQRKVAAVAEPSAAHGAGIRPGDRLSQLDERSVATFGDVQRVLREAGPGKGEMTAVWIRGPYEEEKSGTLRLEEGWKEPTPRVFAWRASKWPLSPKPGFGGRQLNPDELVALGLSKTAFAFRIGYLVTWGENAHTGRNAREAGLRKGDVVVSLCGKSDFDSVAHFHAWFRLTRKAGETCEIVRIRDRVRETVPMTVVD